MVIAGLLEQFKAIIVNEFDVENHSLWLQTVHRFEECWLSGPQEHLSFIQAQRPKNF